MTKASFKVEKPGSGTMILAFLIVLAVIVVLGWWSFSWSTHTLAWIAAFFGVILGVGRSSK